MSHGKQSGNNALVLRAPAGLGPAFSHISTFMRSFTMRMCG